MGLMRRCLLAMLAVLLTGCVAAQAETTPSLSGESPSAPPSSPGPATSTPEQPGPTPEQTGSADPAPSADSSSPVASVKPSSAAHDPTPLPKAKRSGDAKPTITAPPADTAEDVTYSDGVLLRILDVEFGEETEEGPGRFPGRPYALLSLEIDNGGERAIDMNTTIVTVLNADGQQVPPVYVENEEVADFSGEVKPGATSKARYGFALPVASRSQVTVVVDFDGIHTSAVFRGGLG